jgi:hypothetical protein
VDDRALCARVLLGRLLPAPHRRADPPLLECWPSSHVSRLAGVAANCDERAPCFASCRPCSDDCTSSPGLPSAPTRRARYRRAKVLPFLDEPVNSHVRAPSRALDTGVAQGRATDRFLGSALACTLCSQDQGRTFGRACVGAYLASRPQPGAYPGAPP